MANAINNTVQASPGLSVRTPGQPVAITGAVAPQVGMFPPNANSVGATSTAAAMANATLPANVLTTNEGLPPQTLLSALSTGTDGGNQSSPSNGVPFASSSGGGQAGVGGAGGANMNSNVGAVGDVCLGSQALPANLTLQGGAAATQYG